MPDDDIQSSVDKLLAGMDLGQSETFHREKRAEFLRTFLDAYDSLSALALRLAENAESSGAEAAARDSKTVALVVQRMKNAFESVDVVPLPGVGELVDIDHQEVVETRPSDEEDDVILEEIVRGYLWEDRPLRYGKVVIARTPEESGSADNEEEQS